ncbi:cytochrome c oxidase assembly protein [Synoicihabitans lomoniglobus]|uniref:Cytochrome c oxidase assembly protein n=1 Tax=Synoicihabitans lomoniglobus TaxID=2909285 RepID=A0AAF0CG21_9BACT|nr:cytochrome c oxidase assembly protein [Opitutaceae bacterium LMO-M01]WED63092.1 cytochrome c oxidase assembly protein [Opitutaceae bacterium LMO-M01]
MIDWRHWHNEPYLIGGLVLLAWTYAVLTGPLRERLTPGTTVPRWRQVCYYSSLVMFYLAVGSPFDQMGERFLFSAHMAQHVILIYPCAILWTIGLPPALVDAVVDRPVLRPLGRFFTHPVVAGILYVMIQSLWHVPALYDLALQDRLVHVLEHVTFFASAVLFWWPVLSGARVWPPMRLAGQMLYLFAVAVGLTPLFAFVTFSPDVLYPTYEFAPRLIDGFTPMDDQLLAGAIMKLGNVVVTFLGLTFVFTRWYRRSERSNLVAN